MNNPHQELIEKSVDEFGNQFDELNMKPPKNSIPGLERELLKDFMRKALQAQRDAGAREFVSELRKVFMGDDGEDSYITLSARIALFIRKHEALTPLPDKE